MERPFFLSVFQMRSKDCHLFPAVAGTRFYEEPVKRKMVQSICLGVAPGVILWEAIGYFWKGQR